MALCTILKFYPNSEDWQAGDLVEISNPTQLIKEGKVELYVKPEIKKEVVVVAAPKAVVQPKKGGWKKK